MSAAENVLSSIDDTLAEYDGTVSRAGGDMMRWSPQRVICDGDKPMMIGSGPPVRIGNLIAYRASRTPLSVLITVDTTRSEATLQNLRRALNQVASGFQKSAPVTLARLFHRLGCERPARCRTCNPHCNPPPLAIDGHEYNRRRKARQKRTR